MSDLKAIIEALIFASPDPVTVKALAKLLESETSGAAKAEIKEEIVAAIEALKRDYDRPGGLQIVDIAGGYQIVTRPELHEWVRRLFHERTTQKLSVAALETLAVIAYRQPVTGPEVAEIRGVNTAGVLSTLMERKLIKIVGRKPVVGRPFLYGTTREFLERFGLNDLSDLPKVEDMSELLGFELPPIVGEPAPQTPLPFEAEPASAPEPPGAAVPTDSKSVH
jgi:segregation and condensation protein B